MAAFLINLERRIREARAAIQLRYADRWMLRDIVGKLAAKTKPPAIAVRITDRILHKYDAVITRDADGYDIECSTLGDRSQFQKVAQHAATHLYWLMNCPPEVRRMSVTISDGDQSSWAKYSPSTNQAHQVAVPDPYFFDYDGYAWARAWAEESAVPWAQRSDEIVWRGADSGLGAFDPVLGASSPHLAAQRLILWMAALDVPGVDVGISTYGRDPTHVDVLRQYGVLREPVPEKSWAARKFAIDVDGHTNAWSNLLTRLHFGCCVLKVASRHGYRQWYYDRLIPWEHFVPVKADLSDFAEQVEWVRANDSRAAEIAAAGQAFARALTFEATRLEAVELITANAAFDDPFSPPDWRAGLSSRTSP
jgi:hypothetical protein